MTGLALLYLIVIAPLLILLFGGTMNDLPKDSKGNPGVKWHIYGVISFIIMILWLAVLVVSMASLPFV
jgi:hypothetical protein